MRVPLWCLGLLALGACYLPPLDRPNAETQPDLVMGHGGVMLLAVNSNVYRFDTVAYAAFLLGLGPPPRYELVWQWDQAAQPGASRLINAAGVWCKGDLFLAHQDFADGTEAFYLSSIAHLATATSNNPGWCVAVSRDGRTWQEGALDLGLGENIDGARVSYTADRLLLTTSGANVPVAAIDPASIQNGAVPNWQAISVITDNRIIGRTKDTLPYAYVIGRRTSRFYLSRLIPGGVQETDIRLDRFVPPWSGTIQAAGNPDIPVNAIQLDDLWLDEPHRQAVIAYHGPCLWTPGRVCVTIATVQNLSGPCPACTALSLADPVWNPVINQMWTMDTLAGATFDSWLPRVTVDDRGIPVFIAGRSSATEFASTIVGAAFPGWGQLSWETLSVGSASCYAPTFSGPLWRCADWFGAWPAGSSVYLAGSITQPSMTAIPTGRVVVASVSRQDCAAHPIPACQ